MARTGGREARLLVGTTVLATVGAFWLGAGVAHANCNVDPSMCGGMGGGSSDTTPATQPTNSQQSSSGPQVQVVTPQPAPAPQVHYTPPVHHYTPTPQPAAPAVTGTDFTPAVFDTPPPQPPQPGPAVALQGASTPA